MPEAQELRAAGQAQQREQRARREPFAAAEAEGTVQRVEEPRALGDPVDGVRAEFMAAAGRGDAITALAERFEARALEFRRQVGAAVSAEDPELAVPTAAAAQHDPARGTRALDDAQRDCGIPGHARMIAGLRHDARMPTAPALSGLLACPACATPLAGVACLACRTDFPEVGGIPWLMPEPRLALAEWRGRLRHLLTHYASESARQREAAAASGATTRARLGRVAAALDDQAARIGRLMQPLGLERRAEAAAVHAALGTELPLSQGLSTYYPNLHRDWCWGEVENRASFDAVAACLPPGAAPQRLLVLGAGAARLAYDLHQELRPALTVALDFNPLFLLAASRIVAGESLELYEFPIAPRSIDDHARLRRLSAPEPVAPGFLPMLADANAPPFRTGSFDCVLTPWFVDVAGEPVARTLARVNALLAPGGLWLNHGSLAFADAAPADALSLEELVEAAAAAGFARPEPRETRQPYLASPASRHARLESVISFAARKERDVPPPAPGRDLPPWIDQTELPVPALPAIRAQALSTRVYAFLLAMVDGERSIRDMARLMEQQKLMPAEDALPAIRRFLARALQDPDRRPGF